MAGERFDRFMGDSDGIMWTIERDPELRSTIVAVFVLDRPVPFDRVLERLERTSHLIPRMRQRVVETPLRLAPPRWVVDGDFDLGYHVRRVAAPAPRDLRSVLTLAETMAETAFDKERPLWELALVEGLDGGRAASVLKVHHALTDGVGGMRMLGLIMDLEPDAAGPAEHPVPTPEHVAPPALALDALAHTGRQAVLAARGTLASAARGVLGAARDPARAVRDGLRLARSVVRVLTPATRTLSPVMRDRSLRRRFEVFDVDLDELRKAGRAAGGTLNDAFVAAVAGGLHRYHSRRGGPVPHLRMTMPISTRADDDSLGGNRIMPARFPVPVAVDDAAERIRRVGDVCHAWCHEPALPLTDALATVLDHLPAQVTTSLFGSMLKHIDFLTTNVPGSPVPLYLSGSRVEALYALAPTMGASVNTALVSYAGRCGVGVAVDTAAVPDAELLVACIRAGFDEVLTLAA